MELVVVEVASLEVVVVLMLVMDVDVVETELLVEVVVAPLLT